ncbi:hypothetical protein O1R50_06985 [Glycomyces luteolus]|uniref:DUF1963 domain-containing protein n=1 Tax=Glycomyces luteolus TaxID=2670330 RepID=A0A9X3PB71_9ACTN|nr:hypothetical protein [Glycomyces luteolus]MDA1359359.1 hypothetical protein [Glycomyces luteolus]
MPFTTPDRPFDLVAMFPELTTLARTAVRLHPRHGNPTAEHSSIGGPLLWPDDEPWPTCSGPHEWDSLETLDEVFEDRRIKDLAWSTPGGGTPDSFTTEEQAFLDSLGEPGRGDSRGDEFQTAEAPLLPVAQLFTRDVPGLPFRERFDLLQVLWCPYDHPETGPYGAYEPAVHLRLRDTSRSVLRPVYPARNTLVGFKDYVPSPCVLAPEEVTEFPHTDLLSPELREEIKATTERPEAFDYHDNALAPGWKVNGHGARWWIIDAFDVRCECGAEAKPLLTAATGGLDSPTSHWRPLEERDGAAEAPKRYGSVDVYLGRGYDLQIFHCGLDPEHPPVMEMV